MRANIALLYLKIHRNLGKASDKVAALEKAGALVTDSPAKIGSTMLKVSDCGNQYSIHMVANALRSCYS